MKLDNVSNTNPLGNNIVNGFLEILDNSIFIPKNSVNGYFMLCITWRGTIPENIYIPPLATRNIRSVSDPYFDCSTMNNSGSSCSTGIIMCIFQILNSSVDSSIVFDSTSFSMFSLPSNLIQTTLFLTQTDLFTGSTRTENQYIPKISRFILLSPTNTLPLGESTMTVNQFNLFLPSGNIVIPSSTTNPFLFLLMWKGEISSYRKPSFVMTNLTMQNSYFDDGEISNTLCGNSKMLFYMSVLKITDSNAGNGLVKINTDGNLPSGSGNLFVFELT